jgi:spermidine synthase
MKQVKVIMDAWNSSVREAKLHARDDLRRASSSLPLLSTAPRFLQLLGCFLLSGMAGLVYQTAWTQQFALTFGASELAVVAVLAAYMAGLTAGAAGGERWLRAVRRPVLCYGLLEVGIALSALAVPAALRVASRLQLALLGGAAGLPEAGGLVTVAFHLAASFAILLVPTALMGATLPLLARFAVDRDEDLGARVGTLYTVNTIGAALGTLGAGFLLLPSLGLARTVWGGVALNLAAFALAVPLFRARAAPAEDEVHETAPEPSSHRHVLPLMLVSSAVSFTYEVLWTRLLTFVLGASVYAFSTMLATFLAGIALGAAIASRTGRTAAAARRGFALAQWGTAVFSLAAFHLADVLLPRLAERLTASGTGTLLAGAALSATTLLPGALCIGMTFPFAVRMLADRAAQAGAATARAYAWSTVGAVVGAVAGGMWLLPALQFEGTVRVLVATSLLIGLAAALWGRPRLTPLAALAGATLVAPVFFPPQAPWALLRHSNLPGKMQGSVVYCGVGLGSTVIVLDQGGEWRLTSNGLPESAIEGPGSRPSRYAVAHWLSLLAVAARPEARSLMVVGLGAGKTVENVPPSIQSIDVMELEPEIVRANRALAGRRGRDPLVDPRVRIHLNDARSALLLTERRFDAIVSQPSHPWTAGAAHLFTREFFELVRDRLSDDGVFVLWMGQMFVDEPLLRSLLATLRSVFPHVEVYDPRPGGSLLFTSAMRPLRTAEASARAIAGAPAIWAAQGVLAPEDLLAARVQDEEGVARVAEGAPVNTDRYNLLQTRSPRILRNALGAAGTDRVFAPYDPIRSEAAGAAGAHLVQRFIGDGRLPRARRAAGAMPPGAPRRVAQALIDLASGARPRGDAALLQVLHDFPGDRGALHALMAVRGDALTGGTDPDGLLPMIASDPLATAVLEGWRLARGGRLLAVRELEPALARSLRHEPLHEPALRLRIGWRLVSREPERAREAIALLDTFMAEAAKAPDALLRARLAAAAGDPPTVYSSLVEIADLGMYVSDYQQVARDGLKVMEDVEQSSGQAAPSGLRERLLKGSGESPP